MFTSAQASIQANFDISALVVNLFVAPSVISSVSSIDFINAQAAPTLVASVTSAPSSTFKCASIFVLFTPSAIVQAQVIGDPLSTSSQSDPEIATLVTVPVLVVYPASFASSETLSPLCNALSARSSEVFTLVLSLLSVTTPLSIVQVAPLPETVISPLSPSEIPPHPQVISTVCTPFTTVTSTAEPVKFIAVACHRSLHSFKMNILPLPHNLRLFIILSIFSIVFLDE